MNENENRLHAHEMIDHIFYDLFPARGMGPRPAQIQLSHEMLDAMLDGGIALCDAGTGIGKTYAYLASCIAYQRYRANNGRKTLPILISTSSIALQKAVQSEYLPFLSCLLMANGKLDRTIRAVIRKGKGHYVCDERLCQRLTQVDFQRKNPQASAALLALRSCLDMDEVAHLSGYDREKICVPAVCDCGRETCRYQRFINHCGSGADQFQICNHNLLLADALHRRQGKRPILPDRAALIIDEAHKMPETARQMFGVTLAAEDLHELILALKTERYVLAAEKLEEAMAPLLRLMEEPAEKRHPLGDYLHLLFWPDWALAVVRRQLHRMLTPETHRRVMDISGTISLFCERAPHMVFYIEDDGHGGSMLCATPSGIEGRLRETLWSQPVPMVLTSGTLSVGADFRRFKEETGLCREGRVRESVSPSPFDYKRNCLLFLPRRMPRMRDGESDVYYRELATDIAALLEVSHGHALVLFTSYAAMSAVKAELEKRSLPYPLYTMGRSAFHTMEQFKASPGSVLLATGAAWEGFDFPGDCVSMLIMPRLPFAYPDARMERERENYPTLRDFIQAVVVPEMQIKLRQGFGRAIRTDTDTCVVAILDERAKRGRRYHNDVLEALPEMRRTSSLNEARRFFHSVKPDSYFTKMMEDAA